SALGVPSSHRIQLGDVSARRLGHHPEFIEPHHRVVSDLELESRLLLELAQEVRLLLHEVQGDIGMQPHGELALLVLRAGPLERALHTPHHYLGTEHAPRAVTGRALRGHRLPQRGAHPLSDRKSTRLNSSHVSISYAVFCLK